MSKVFRAHVPCHTFTKDPRDGRRLNEVFEATFRTNIEHFQYADLKFTLLISQHAFVFVSQLFLPHDAQNRMQLTEVSNYIARYFPKQAKFDNYNLANHERLRLVAGLEQNPHPYDYAEFRLLMRQLYRGVMNREYLKQMDTLAQYQKTWGIK